MKRLISILFALPAVVFADDFPGVFSGEIAAEYRYYPNEGAYGNTEKHHGSIIVRPEYTLSWDNDRRVVSVIPFIRYDQQDAERSHGDIRELSLVSSWSAVELRLGISKVFWGVTESQHLVDVINQTDLVENPDGEQKLGQPMINPTLISDAGYLDLFILPFFRERTFSGAAGRYRGPIVVDTDQAEYTHPDAEKHIDFALRWRSNWQDLEWALSYFKGTDRDPAFRYDTVQNVLIPVYGQSKQAGLELQYIYEDWLLKAELLCKDSFQYGLYTATTAGFEYTLTNIHNGMDIGLLYEWLYDSRGEMTPNGVSDSSFIATRIAFNNAASTEILAGVIIDNTNSNMSVFRIEASHRLSGSYSLDVELNVIGQPPKNSVLNQFRADDYLQLKLSSYF